MLQDDLEPALGEVRRLVLTIGRTPALTALATVATVATVTVTTAALPITRSSTWRSLVMVESVEYARFPVLGPRPDGSLSVGISAGAPRRTRCSLC